MIEKKVVATYNKTTDSPQMKGLWGFLRVRLAAHVSNG